MTVIISAVMFLYCAVFFLKKTNQKIAALFIVDSFVLIALFMSGAAPVISAAFVISAACLNVTVFFIPSSGQLSALTGRDYIVIGVNAVTAALLALYMLKNQQPGVQQGIVNPVITAFLFMALSVAGYFTASAVTGEKK